MRASPGSKCMDYSEAIKVSVIIPAYNNESTIERAIDSVLTQDFDRFEVIVIDDGSTDSTGHLLAHYGAQIQVLRQANRGAAAARNLAARGARGEYLAFLDADDEWLPGKLRTTVAALDQSAGAALAYSDFVNVSSNGERSVKSPMQGSPTLADLLRDGVAFFPTVVVMRRSAFIACGGFSEEFRGAGFEDSFMGLVAREQGEFIHVNQPLAVYYDAGAMALAAKYRRGYHVLTRLVRERYGKSGAKFIATGRAYYASLLVTAAADQIRMRQFLKGSMAIVQAAIVDPDYVFKALMKRRRVA
jgi:glycosyltransferase involved in cell wall biosynthesis